MQKYDTAFIIWDINLRGGTEILTKNLMKSLNSIGYQCCIISIVPYKGKEKNIFSLSTREYELLISKTSKFKQLVSGGAYQNKVLQNLIKNYAELLGIRTIICQTYDIASALPFNQSIRVFQVLNWSIYGYESALLKKINNKSALSRHISKRLFESQNRRCQEALKRVDGLIVLTTSAANEVSQLADADKIQIIGNPIMHSSDSQVVSTGKNKSLVFVGRFSEEKGVFKLLRIWKMISQQLPEYSLKMYGEGPLQSKIQEEIENQELTNITLEGFSTDEAAIYANADLLLMTSETESFGMVLPEAMYYGVPVIAFDCPVSPKEVIANCGILIPCFDEKLYAEQTISVLKNREEWCILHNRAIARSRDFHISNIIKRWETICHR